MMSKYQNLKEIQNVVLIPSNSCTLPDDFPSFASFIYIRCWNNLLNIFSQVLQVIQKITMKQFWPKCAIFYVMTDLINHLNKAAYYMLPLPIFYLYFCGVSLQHLKLSKYAFL